MKIKTGDWKGEKHVPLIEVERKGEIARIDVWVGKEIPHPNTPEHHIAWIDIYFVPEGADSPIHLARVEFLEHGDVKTEPRATIWARIGKGKIVAISYCNIHGVWMGEKEVS